MTDPGGPALTDPTTRAHPALRLGYIADGCFKLLVAAALPTAATRIGASRHLAVVASGAVLASAVSEIDFGVRSGSGSHTRYLVAYDSGWLAASGLAAFLARREAPHAGRVWLGYQAAASIPLAIAFSRGRRRRSPR